SKAIALYVFKLGMDWFTIASGAFAAHSAITSGTGLPSLTGRSKKRGGFVGSGDQAAAEASMAFVPKSAAATCASVCTSPTRAMSAGFGLMFAFRQQGLCA